MPESLDPCVATKCQYIPIPPQDIGMVYLPDQSNSLSLQSELSVYNPKLPMTMRFPGPEFCLENNLFLLVGSIPDKARRKLEVYFVANGTDEAFHLSVDLDQEYIRRWAVQDNLTEDIQGEPGEGTTIDRDEPFMMRCDLMRRSAKGGFKVGKGLKGHYTCWIFNPTESDSSIS